jgi:hypothetical protein
MELWRYAQRIVDAPVDVLTKLIKREKLNDELRYFGIFLIITAVLIAMIFR